MNESEETVHPAEGGQGATSGQLSGPPAPVVSEAPPPEEQVSSPPPSQGPAEEGMALPQFVYALGRVEPRFPSLALEREFAQVLGRGNNEGLTDRQALQAVMSERSNRYLARRLCWVFLIEGLETYILAPRDPADFDLLIDAIRSEPRRDDVDVVIGARGPIAPPEACGGLSIPAVFFDQLYSFDRDSLIESIPRPESVTKAKEDQFRSAAGELFDRIMQLADNAGATDDHRALNYLAVRYPAMYGTATEAFGRSLSLSAVEVRPSRLSGVRNILDVIFSYTHRETDVTEKYFVRVDVTEEFPFLITKMSPFYER
jgi:hypothetical protein